MAKILITEHRDFDRKVFVTLLRVSGHIPIEARDGVEALQLITSERPDLVVSELSMPSMDGFEFVRRLRSDPKIADTQVIFYTAILQEDKVGKLAESCGVKLVLIKPLEPEVLLRKINETLKVSSSPALLALLGVQASPTYEDAALTQAQKMDALGRLASDVAHDFNNILAVIIGYGERLQKGFAEDDTWGKPIKRIMDAAQCGVNLTRRLQAISRKDTVNPKLLDLNPVVEGIKRQLLHLVGETVELKFMPSSGPVAVRMDPFHVEQVLINLTAHAREAMPEGGKLSISLTEATVDDACIRIAPGAELGRYAVLAITDTGNGRNEESKAHSFDPSFAANRQEKITELGLAAVYRIVKEYKGFISVSSELQEGTTFKVHFPIADSQEDRKLTEDKKAA